jgi:peptidoglycan/xylan/chitin deacetylase (PgdA/CDA1 family)
MGKCAFMNPWPILISSAVGACAGVAAWGAVNPGSEIFGPSVHRTPHASMIALTFDDGPNPAITPQLLELLARYGTRATFFLVGRVARACPELVCEIADRGHSIGNHTETHPNLAWMPAWQIVEELKSCQESILRALGFERDAAPILMRPPFGFRGPQLWSATRRAGLQGVAMWSVTSYDWKPQPASRLIERLGRVVGRNPAHGEARNQESSLSGADRAQNPGEARRRERGAGPGGEIVLLHDGDFRHWRADRSHVLAALEYWLPRWRDAGFEFVTMNELVAPGVVER